MAKTWNETTIEQLEHVASQLRKAQEKIAAIMTTMVENKMQKAFMPWTQSHTTYLGAITKFAEEATGELDNQITAKRLGHKSRVEIDKKRAEKTTRKGQSTKKKPKPNEPQA